MNDQTVQQGKMYAVIAYLTLFGTLVAFFMNRDKPNEFTSFHIRQSLGIGLVYIALSYVIGSFDSLKISGAFMLVFLFIYLYGIYRVIIGKATPIPFIGPYFQNIFKSIGQ
ncbi:MAG: hypothetical protein AAGH46_07360 [Bacteroidota bacterium]